MKTFPPIRGSATQCGNYGKSLSCIFDKNFVKSMVLLKKWLNSWFDEFIFRWERISRFSTLWASVSKYNTFSVFTSTNFPSNQMKIKLQYSIWRIFRYIKGKSSCSIQLGILSLPYFRIVKYLGSWILQLDFPLM